MILNEIISGFLISLVMIPESIAFSYFLDLPASTGIQTAMVMSFITSIFGTPALISGATASIATSLYGVVKYIGKEYIPITVILGGIIQLLIGFLGLYKFIDKLPKSVNSGFLIALALLIGYSQINNFKDQKKDWFQSDEMFNTIFFTIIGLFIIQFSYIYLNFFNMKITIPGGLIEILLLTLFFYFFPINVQHISDKGELPRSLPTFKNPLPNNYDISNIAKTIPFAIAMATSGLIESLIMVGRMNTMKNKEYSGFNEVIVQGFANIVSGLTGGMGGCVLVGESMMNLNNGSETHISSFSTSLFFILFNLFFYKFINLVPICAIISIMLYIAYLTGDWESLIKQKGKNLFVIILTSLIGFASNSLTLGVIIGYIASIMV
jgi:SulP family sulfate permease